MFASVVLLGQPAREKRINEVYYMMIPLLLLLVFIGISCFPLYLYFNLRSQSEQQITKLHKERESLRQASQLINQELQKLKTEYGMVSQELSMLKDRFRDIVDIDKEKQLVVNQLQAAQLEFQNLQPKIKELHKELDLLNEEANLQSFGFYKPHYDFASAESYQTKLSTIQEEQKKLIKDKAAAVCPIEWAVNGSVVEGRKQINQTLKLILRAFNGECDAAIAKVKYNNIKVMEARIEKSFEAINSLAQVQKCNITRSYLGLKLEELRLSYEYQERLQLEKEEQKRIREQMREEEKAQKELEKIRYEAEQEENRYQAALNKARQEMEKTSGEKHNLLATQIQQLQQKLEEAQANKERAKSRAQLTRSGHVYIISNIGSFGENVFKIGMTRRLDPMERVHELGDASVPFEFDVHAMIYSEDAPTLENSLHRAFHYQRLNKVNERKEFFNVTIEDIAKHVHQHNRQIEITHIAEAKEYRQSLAQEQSLVAK